ncbi:hypothetical protein BJ996_007006 [Streptomyces phaeogriseichromatogenes]|nr:hypothetical protein [Streptomyces murinus]BBC91462.1 hypothetical protein SRO_0286 [Streptomyces rochei]
MAISAIGHACSIWSTVTWDRPLAVDVVQAEPAKAHQGLLTQVLRAPDRRPRPEAQAHQSVAGPDRVRAAASLSDLRRDERLVEVGVDRLADDLLADVGAVGVRGVDQLHAELDATAFHAD